MLLCERRWIHWYGPSTVPPWHAVYMAMAGGQVDVRMGHALRARHDLSGARCDGALLLPFTGHHALRPAEARAVTNDPGDRSVLRVLEADELHQLCGQLFGEPAVTLDYKWFRAIAPPEDPHEVHGSFHVDVS